MRRDKVNIIILAAGLAVAVFAAALVGYSVGASGKNSGTTAIEDASVDVQAADIEPQIEPAIISSAPMLDTISGGSIAVPGFERLTVSGITLQADSIINPERNACYFVVSLMLADGTEIFRSEILSPGQSIGNTKILKSLAPGTYKDAIARYSCYDINSLQPLNGADITFILEVLP